MDVNGLILRIRKQTPFERYTPLHPNEKFNLSDTSDMPMRIMDLILLLEKDKED
ncbi:MAG: hypothetical protein CM1200mP31_3180 [Candidatus Neomarinimicrobiota bacterium]|nr:MAG: hypothetical protein CM1200mP31_3180 [Candidatus Neomarinimicrobiota bacterium]